LTKSSWKDGISISTAEQIVRAYVSVCNWSGTSQAASIQGAMVWRNTSAVQKHST
jgi:hypothetical protein